MVPSKISKTITMVGGSNETFDELERGITESAKFSMDFDADSGLSTTVTITMQVKYGTSWKTLTDSNGDDVTGTVAPSGSLSFPAVDVPPGAQVRPIFETDATGDITVISWA